MTEIERITDAAPSNTFFADRDTPPELCRETLPNVSVPATSVHSFTFRVYQLLNAQQQKCRIYVYAHVMY